MTPAGSQRLSSYLWKHLDPYGVHMLKYDSDGTCVGFPAVFTNLSGIINQCHHQVSCLPGKA